jgi:hypothetical protein
VKRSPVIPLAITVLAILSIVIGWRIYWPIESQRYAATRKVERSSSVIRMTFEMTHQLGPIAKERLTFVNVNGKAEVAYEGTNRPGTAIARFRQPVNGFSVATLFGEVVRDGVWDLTNKPPRGDTSTSYTIAVYQLTDNQSGGRTITFTDPHYWATTGGRQYQLHLEKDKPIPDLLTLHSTSISEPRYGELVHDFDAFNAPGFRATLAAARAKLRAA